MILAHLVMVGFFVFTLVFAAYAVYLAFLSPETSDNDEEETPL
jgi:hypothetical protein